MVGFARRIQQRILASPFSLLPSVPKAGPRGKSDLVRTIQRPGEFVKGAVTELSKEAIPRGGVKKTARELVRTVDAVLSLTDGDVAKLARQSGRNFQGQRQLATRVVREGVRQARKTKTPSQKQLAARAAFAKKYGGRKGKK